MEAFEHLGADDGHLALLISALAKCLYSSVSLLGQ